MKILVVEDDRKVAGFIEQGLREEGYVVDVAGDGDHPAPADPTPEAIRVELRRTRARESRADR